MARTLTAYLRKTSVPSRKALQEALQQAKFPLTLDEGYTPGQSAGYLACVLDGEDAGFDLRFKSVPGELPVSAAVQAQLADRDTALQLKWGGDPREQAAASLFCAALLQSFDALVQEDDKDALLSFAQLKSKADSALG